MEPFVIIDPGPGEPPPSPPVRRAPVGHRTWLFFGLLVFFVGFALPLVLLLWAAAALFGTDKIAELLAKTHGLAPTTYGGAFWLAVVFILVMLVIEAWSVFRPRSERPGCLVALLTRPSIGLLLLFVPTRLLVVLDVQGTDVPDVLTTFLLLATLGYLYTILPFALIAALGRFSLGVWRRGAASSFGSGVFGALGIALASVMPILCVTQEDVAEGIVAKTRELVTTVGEVVDSGSPAERSHAELVKIADGGLRSVDLGDRGRFNECIRALTRLRNGKIKREEVREFLRRRYEIDASLADDIVDQKVLHVCLRHSRQPIGDLVPYFVKAAKNETLRRLRRRSVRESCLVDAEGGTYDPYPGRSDFMDFTAHLCQLSARDQRLLEMMGEGHTSGEIAKELGLEPENVRQIQSRRLKDLRAKLAH